MALVVSLIKFTGAAAAHVAPAGTYVKKIVIEPARANTSNMFVGNSSLTQLGTVGMIADLAEPSSSPSLTVDLDQLVIDAQGSDHNYDASDLWVWGATNDYAKVTYWTI